MNGLLDRIGDTNKMSAISSTDERLFKTLANADVVDVSRMDAVREMEQDEESYYESQVEEASAPNAPPHPAPSRFDSIVNEHLERRSKAPSAHSVSSVRRQAPAAPPMPPMPPMPGMSGGRDDDMLAKQ